MKHLHYKKSGPQADKAGGSFLFPKKIIRGNNTCAGAAAFSRGQRTALIADSYIMKNFGGIMDAAGEFEGLIFKGEACPGEFYRIKKELVRKKIRVIVSAGGGKVIDTCKFLAGEIKGLRHTCIPLSAATCSSMTPVSVVYSEKGGYMDTVDTKIPDVIIIDYAAMESLPMAFFAAGLADTLAKHFEIKACGKAAAIKTRYSGFISDYSAAVYGDMKKILKKWKKPCYEMKKQLVELNIFHSGMISLFGRFTGTSFIAHVLAYAMTFNDKAKGFLHGEHAGFSALVQEAYLKNSKNAEVIEKALETMEMPARFTDFGIDGAGIGRVHKEFFRLKTKEKLYIPISENIMYNVIESFA